MSRRAFRRPTTPEDLAIVMGFYKEGRAKGTFDSGIEMALRRILASPDFLYRAEREPVNVSPQRLRDHPFPPRKLSRRGTSDSQERTSPTRPHIVRRSELRTFSVSSNRSNRPRLKRSTW